MEQRSEYGPPLDEEEAHEFGRIAVQALAGTPPIDPDSAAAEYARGMDAHAWRRVHVALGVLVCVAIPAASWLDGSGRLAYTMFAETEWYRVEVEGVDEAGNAFPISPTVLANATGGGAAIYFAGADRYHLTPTWRTPRRLLDDAARLGCTVDGRAARVTVRLFERDPADGPVRSTSGSASCAR